MVSNIIVWGTGHIAKSILEDKLFSVIAFVDSDVQKLRDGFCNIPFVESKDINSFDSDAIVVALPYENLKDKKIIGDAVDYIESMGISKDKIFLYFCNERGRTLVDYENMKFLLNINISNDSFEILKRVPQKSILLTHMPFLIERCRDRKLYIYGAKDDAFVISEYLSLHKLNVEKYIYDDYVCDDLEEDEVVSIIDLVYEQKDDIFILVVNENKGYGVPRKKLIDMGFIEDYDFSYYSEIPATKESFYYDVTLSYNRIKDEIEGFEVFGDIENPKALKIVVLGGSTTESSLSFVKGWAHYMSDIFMGKNIPAIVYCGGVAGYTSSQELLKLIRDVVPLNPDLVISYSGANDLYQYPKTSEPERYQKPFITQFQVKFINQILRILSPLKQTIPMQSCSGLNNNEKDVVFWGLKNNKSSADFWIDNMKMMNFICTGFGIKFISFFQPFRFNGYYKGSNIQDVLHSRRSFACAPESRGIELWNKPIKKDLDEIIKKIKEHEFIYDLSKIFSKYDDVYYDITHVYERGNIIIAKEIFESLSLKKLW